MTDEKKLEHFKFATIKNVLIKVDEQTSGEISIKIEANPTELNRPISISYQPLDHYDDGTFTLKDNHKKITIERVYAVPARDDIDWDIENVYPCDFCARKNDWIRKLEEKVEKLKEIINKIID